MNDHTTNATETKKRNPASWRDKMVSEALGLDDEDVSSIISAFAGDLEIIGRGIESEDRFIIGRMAARADIIGDIAGKREGAFRARIVELESARADEAVALTDALADYQALGRELQRITGKEITVADILKREAATAKRPGKRGAK